jgi:ATP-dependent DNA helicase RecQ
VGVAEDILKKYWGYASFRPLQKEIIDDIISGNDVLALLPTGGGKSVTYQVPAILQDGLCLVISPLIALMQDQVKHLQAIGISAACIHAGMHYMQVRQTLDNALHGGYKLLYISPERLQSELFSEYLPSLQLNLITVDEAHCISQWGYDFRPDYLKIATIRELFYDTPILALTATATTATRKDIIDKLELESAKVHVQSFERKNINYSVLYTENKNNAVIEHLKACKFSSIIYCRSRKQTEVLVNYLSQNEIKAVAYHAGMNKDKRVVAQESWMNNVVKTMVATTAFGMGIDKPDVGLVLHYDTPEHLEAYYQEAGRAGRNNQDSFSVVLYNNTDIKRLEESTTLSYPDLPYLRKIYQSVAEYLQIPIGIDNDTYYPFDLSDFCKKFNLPTIQTSSALRLLAQEELWTLTDTVFTPNTVYIKASKRELEDILDTYPQFSYLMINLLRLYGSLFQYPTPVRLKLISSKVKMTIDEVERCFMQLQSMGILEYQKPLEGAQLYFHHYRVDSNHLLINTERINALKNKHIERTDAMIVYLTDTAECRTQVILRYFGEQKNEKCGHCDICLQKQMSPVDVRGTILMLTITPLHITTLLNHFPSTQKEYVLSSIRGLVDEKQLSISPDQIVQHLNG